MGKADIGTPLLSLWDGTGTWQAVTGLLSESHAAWVADEVAEKAAKAIYAVTKREVMEALMDKPLAEPEHPPSLVIPLNVLRGLLGKLEMCQHRCGGAISEFNGNRNGVLRRAPRALRRALTSPTNASQPFYRQLFEANSPFEARKNNERPRNDTRPKRRRV